MPLCPVCLTPIGATDQYTPTVEEHADHIGKVCPMSGQPLPQWDERSTRAAVKGRSGGICEHCLRQRATDMHHRISAGTGGWWSPANILHLCRLCHSKLTDNPNWAYSLGLMLRRTQDPNAVPMMRQNGELMYVTDEVAA